MRNPQLVARCNRSWLMLHDGPAPKRAKAGCRHRDKLVLRNSMSPGDSISSVPLLILRLPRTSGPQGTRMVADINESTRTKAQKPRSWPGLTAHKVYTRHATTQRNPFNNACRHFVGWPLLWLARWPLHHLIEIRAYIRLHAQRTVENHTRSA